MKRPTLHFLHLTRLIIVAVGATGLLFSTPVQAATYTWINPSGGNWSAGANWSGGTAPISASGSTADFSQVGLTSTTTINVDTAVTIGNIIIGNSNTIGGGTSYNWIFTNNILTLGGGASSITVTNMGTGKVIITNVIAGVSGLVKAGPGVLELDNADTFTNGTTIAGGTLILGFNQKAGETNQSDLYTLGATGGGPAALLVNLTGYNLNNPISLANDAVGPLFLGNYGAQKADFFGNISLNGNNLIFTNGSDNTSNSKFLAADTVTGIGNITCINNSPDGNMTVGVLNNTGSVTMEGSSPNASGFTMTFGASVTKLSYVGPASMAAFTAPANSAGLTINSSSANNLGGITLAAGLSNLTLNANSSGSITISVIPATVNGFIENAGTGTGPVYLTPALASGAGISNIIQDSATSPLILSGTNGYGNAVTVSNGTLLVNGPGNNGSITVHNGGIFGGIGTIAMLVTVQSGGTLSPGTNDGYTLGTLSLSNGGLALSGNLFFKLHKGLTQSNDLVNVVNSSDILTNFGTGTLTITNVGPALAVGDRFYLFSKALVGGGSLTIASAGNTFTNNLALNGSISVVSAGSLPPPPVVTSLSPTSGYTIGGTVVTITGTNFATGDTVKFGSTTGTGITVNSSTNITVTTPAGTAGTVNVTVTDTYSQSSTLTNGFTYVAVPPPPVITRLSPTIGYIAGGTVVTIIGTNFVTGDTVMFGSSSGTSITVFSSTNLTVTTPAESAGTVNVTVTDTYSQSSTLTNGFTYAVLADVGVTMTGPAAVGPAVNFTYTISVTNYGPASSSSVVVTDTLPSSVVFVSANGGGADNSGVVNWALGTLAMGQGSNVTVTVTSPSSGIVTNYTIVSSGTLDTNLANNTSSLITTVTNGALPNFGVWVAVNGGGDGLWTGDSGNWSNSVVPRALGQTAYFNAGNYTGTQVVHVDASVTNGYQYFGTTNTGTAVQWTVDNNANAGNILTLATTSGPPVIAVNDPHALGNSAIITAVMAGNQGLALSGGGKLTLGNGTTANSFIGGIIVSNGTLFIQTNAYADTTDSLTLGSTLAGSSATLLLGNTAFPNPIVLVPAAQGTLTISGDPISEASEAISGPAVNLNGNTLTFVAVAGSTGNSYFSNGVTNNGNLILAQNGTGTLINNGTYNNSGSITLQGTGTGAFNLGTLNSNLTVLNYDSSSATVSGTPTIYANNNGTTINSGSTLNIGFGVGGFGTTTSGTNLTLNCNSTGNILVSSFDYRFSGLVENSGTGSGTATISGNIYNNSGLTKMIQDSATSPLILSGKNYYNVPTVVSNGWLAWNCGYTPIQVGSPITVCSNGTLSGTGWIPNLVTVQPAGTLAPGTNDGFTLGTLIITNDASSLKGALSLSGNLFFKIHKGLAQSNDLVSIVGPADTLTNLGTGTLTISNVGPVLVAGDTFYLFSKALIGGGNLTIFSPGNIFTNNLALNGSVSLVSSGSLPPPPVITSLTPTNGSTAGGTVVTVTGTNFVGGDTVKFASTTGTGVSVNSSTSLTVTTPAGSAGAVNVTVTDAYSQSSTLTGGFTYVLPPPPVVKSLIPTNGSTAGGTVVTISGTNFLSGDTVKFGSTAGTGVTVNSLTNITVTTPAGSVGAVNVTVTDSSSQSSTLTNGFTYVLPAPPVVTSLTPTNGYTTGGTVVAITGTNFLSGDTVNFASTAGTSVTVNSITNITVTTPAGSAGTVNVTVTDTSSRSSTLTNGFTYTTPPSSGSPAIVITNVPPYGSYGPNVFLSGYVTNANTATNCVMVCDYWPNENPSPQYDAKLSPWGWFSRPTFASYLTPLQPNGNWSCAMPSNFDQYATEYAVMLVPTNFNQGAVNAASGLPLTDIGLAEAIDYTDRTDTNRRAITWSGYNWWVKTAGADGNEFLAATGPGPNYYSDSTNNVWVDAQGLLHLQITDTNGEWECVQIWNDQTLGYGQYSCTLNANISNLDANVIFSMFTWSDDDDYVNREIDMEVSRWDYAFGSNDVEDFAISPYDSGQTLRFGLPPGVTNSTHTFTWESTNSVAFETYNGNYSSSPASSNVLESWTTTAQPIPPQGGEEATLILWLYHGNAPLSGQPVQVTLSSFEFTPYGSQPPGQDAVLSGFGNSPITGQPTGIANAVGRTMTISFSGTPNAGYSVQRSTNLLTGWVTLWTTNAPPGGLFKYTDNFNDLGGTPPPAAYYRLSW